MPYSQFAKRRFWQLIQKYREAQSHMDTEEGRRAFIILSLQLHAAKGDVPKNLWKYAKLGGSDG